MKRAVSLAAALIVFGIACRASKEPAAVEMGPAEEKQARSAAPEAPVPAAPPSRLQQVGPPPSPSARRFIRNGSLSLEVRSVDVALVAVKSLLESEGGYVGNESQSENEYRARSASVTCRVPAERLPPVVEKLKGLGKLESLNITAEEITEQYFNLEIRIANQKQLEARLLELLRRPTNQLKDLLEIEREYARVRGEIDGLEGRKRFWDNQVALSTLVVSLHEPRPPITGTGGGVLRTLLNSFQEAAENFISTIAGIIALAGAVLPIAVLLWLAFFAWKRRRRRAAN